MFSSPNIELIITAGAINTLPPQLVTCCQEFSLFKSQSRDHRLSLGALTPVWGLAGIVAILLEGSFIYRPTTFGSRSPAILQPPIRAAHPSSLRPEDHPGASVGWGLAHGVVRQGLCWPLTAPGVISGAVIPLSSVSRASVPVLFSKHQDATIRPFLMEP